MNKPVAAIFLLVGLSASPAAQDVTTLEKIGPVVSFTKTDKAVAFTCRDNSQVQVTILASDLIRVRASFARPLPERDHSWAIAKENWETPRWSLKETTESVTITTDEVEVVVRRSPLLIEFRDARSHGIPSIKRFRSTSVCGTVLPMESFLITAIGVFLTLVTRHSNARGLALKAAS